MAEAFLKDQLVQASSEIEVFSAGISAKSDESASEEAKKGFENFTVIKIFIYEIEWLFLASQGHRRALFKINRDNSNLNIESKWLVP